MGIELKALRWLTYHRRGASVVHYHRYEIAKKTGGMRCISAPKPALDAAQIAVACAIVPLFFGAPPLTSSGPIPRRRSKSRRHSAHRAPPST